MRATRRQFFTEHSRQDTYNYCWRACPKLGNSLVLVGPGERKSIKNHGCRVQSAGKSDNVVDVFTASSWQNGKTISIRKCLYVTLFFFLLYYSLFLEFFFLNDLVCFSGLQALLKKKLKTSSVSALLFCISSLRSVRFENYFFTTFVVRRISVKSFLTCAN